MIIGIDGNEANVERKVGIGEYAYELLMQFVNLKSQVSDLKFVIYLKNTPREDLPSEQKNWQYRVIGPKKFWTQFGLPLDLFFHKPRPDIFFTPTHYAPRFAPMPTVVSVMDLSYIHFPELFKKSDLYQLKNWTSYSVRNAVKVFTISNASKDDIIKVYKVPEDKVVVTYPGIKHESEMILEKNMKDLRKKYGIGEDYILYVGTLQPRKNIVRLIEAFSKINHDNIFLVIVGKKGWLYEEILSAPKKFKVENSVKFLDFVPEKELPIIYRNALCFVLPSLYEGFGLPVLEAMKYGCAVITSNISSLPEAGGDAALYVDPMSVDDIASKIKMLINDKKLRNDLVEKGKKQVKKFSWEKTAKETLSVLTKIANE